MRLRIPSLNLRRFLPSADRLRAVRTALLPSPERRRFVYAGLIIVAATVAWFAFGPSTSAPDAATPPPAAATAGATPAQPRTAAPATEAPTPAETSTASAPLVLVGFVCVRDETLLNTLNIDDETGIVVTLDPASTDTRFGRTTLRGEYLWRCTPSERTRTAPAGTQYEPRRPNVEFGTAGSTAPLQLETLDAATQITVIAHVRLTRSGKTADLQWVRLPNGVQAFMTLDFSPLPQF